MCTLQQIDARDTLKVLSQINDRTDFVPLMMEAATALWRDCVVLSGPGIVGLATEPSNLPDCVDKVHHRQTKHTACFILRPFRLNCR